MSAQHSRRKRILNLALKEKSAFHDSRNCPNLNENDKNKDAEEVLDQQARPSLLLPSESEKRKGEQTLHPSSPLPPAAKNVETEQTPRPSLLPLASGKRTAKQTPRPFSPLPPAAENIEAEHTPRSSFPLPPVPINMEAEQTSRPSSPLPSGAKNMEAKQMPRPSSPLPPAAKKMEDEQTPRPSSPLLPAAKNKEAEQTPRPSSPLPPAATNMEAEQMPRPSSPLPPAATNMEAEQMPRPSSPLPPAAKNIETKQTPRLSSPLPPAAKNMEAEQTLPLPLVSGKKVAKQIPRTPSPLPPASENINVVLADVWNDVFGSDKDLVPQVQASPIFEELTPFDIETPSSFNNSPAVCIDEFEQSEVSTPASTHLYLATPMPSPLNAHKPCNDPFCPDHNTVTTWIDSVGSVELLEETDASSPRSESSTNSKRSKKRPQRNLEWSDVKRKCLTNLGKSYISKRGKLVDGKVIGKVCSCKNKCGDKISEKDRLETFTKFWQLGDREKKWAFIIKYVEKSTKKRCLNGSPNRRQYTFKYFLPLVSQTTDVKCLTVNVCKTMFLNSLSVSERTVKTAFLKYDGISDVEQDNRGRHTNHKTVINTVMIISVCDHVNSFVPVESHYCRKDSTKLYLDGSLSVSRMFKMYEEWFDGAVYSSKVKTERQYRDIVNKNFNLAFHIPKKDQCTTCHAYRNKQHHTNEEKKAQDEHLKAKKSARNLKQRDKLAAEDSDGSVLTAVFDFEKVLSCPHGDVNIYYYKRKLSFFNFTIFDMGKKKGVCYLWDETVANRGATEVASCLLDFIDFNVKKEGVNEFRFWSDNCPGQNKNRYVFSLFMYAAKKYKVSITHRFLEKGHTQNEGDSVHALIERSASCKSIYIPDEWRLLIRWAKAEGEPYVLRNMTKENFFDFKSHVNDRAWSKNTNKETIAWLEIKEVFVDKSEPNKLYYKYDLDQEDYKCLVVRNGTRNSLAAPSLQRVYTAPIKISKDKYKDLISMVDTHVIPEQYAEYFKSLPHRTISKDTPSAVGKE